MTDSMNIGPPGGVGPTTLAELVRGVDPMGDLRQFAIEDLTVEEEDEFFGLLSAL